MTTFIDFRFLRALAEALFSGREKEEAEVFLAADRDNYFVLDLKDNLQHDPQHDSRHAPRDGLLAEFTRDDGSCQARLVRDPAGLLRILDHNDETLVSAHCNPVGGSAASTLVGVRLGPNVSGLKFAGKSFGMGHEAECSIFGPDGQSPAGLLRLVVQDAVHIMGRGSGRLGRWGELWYRRAEPPGPCVELTMDWHHLRAGIPLFGTMTAEELIEAGWFKLRFRSYAYDRPQSDTTDFVRLFASPAPADVALHLTPSLYTPLTPGIPNVAFAVVESEEINAHIIERCNAMDHVMVPTHFVRDALQKAGTTTPIEVVSHGVDAGYFRPPAVPGTLPGGKSFNFLAVGTHVERKNFRHLVRAFLEEFRESEDVALYLLLRPEYMTTQHNVVLEFTDWERQWAEDSAPIYIWTGYLTRDHLRDFYANANAYVMPSNEGFGLTLLEAMACGTPVIALDYGGVTDFVHSGNGILVKRGRAFVAQDIDTLPYVGDVFHAPDIGDLRRAMRRLFESPGEVNRLGEQARRDALAMSWRVVGERVGALLERAYREAGTDQPLAYTAGHLGEPASLASAKLTLVLCVMDDESARSTLKHLAAIGDVGIRVMCLFTRYARIKDVLQSRRHGFINYRWDGTTANAISICRSVLGPGWLLLLKPGERLRGDLSKLHQALGTIPPEVSEMTVQCAGGAHEPRIVHTRSTHDSNETREADKVAHCQEVDIC